MRERIQQIMDNERLTPSAFADKLGIGRAVMSHILNGRNNPSLDVVTRILSVMHTIDSNWLLSGDGDMYKNDRVSSPTTDSSFLDFSDESESHLYGHNEKSSTQTTEPAINVANRTVETGYRTHNIVDTTENRTNNAVNEASMIGKLTSKKIDKIIIYYTDNTFEIFEPNKKSI